MTTNHTPKSDALFSEAPASWNTKYLTPEGFECQITLRAESGSELLEKAANAIAYLLKSGCLPYTYRPVQRPAPEPKSAGESNPNSNGTSSRNSDTPNPAWCPIHQCEMKRWDKNGKVWYSHKIDGMWCTGK
jgi:hypothetical protein